MSRRDSVPPGSSRGSRSARPPPRTECCREPRCARGVAAGRPRRRLLARLGRLGDDFGGLPEAAVEQPSSECAEFGGPLADVGVVGDVVHPRFAERSCERRHYCGERRCPAVDVDVGVDSMQCSGQPRQPAESRGRRRLRLRVVAPVEDDAIPTHPLGLSVVGHDHVDIEAVGQRRGEQRQLSFGPTAGHAVAVDEVAQRVQRDETDTRRAHTDDYRVVLS